MVGNEEAYEGYRYQKNQTMQDIQLKQITNEILFLKEMKNEEGIVKLRGVYHESIEKVHIVLDFAEAGNLGDYLRANRPLPEEAQRSIMRQLLQTLKIIHAKDIVHRDIKPCNILVLSTPTQPTSALNQSDCRQEYSDTVKVCYADFGLAYRYSAEDQVQLNQLCGTPGYIDPELLRGGACSSASDIFSLGSVFFNIITGRLLYPGKSASEVLAKSKALDPT